ncbi:MAG: hypothetical protein NT028_11295 [candidate division Zixibacteria bacterium]|nr:hypothetical protein [candidate division Zixibacteria bacterium]
MPFRLSMLYFSKPRGFDLPGHFDTGDKTKAREHAEKAKERAECGYVPALNQAVALLGKL